jgi:hypothetical protein
MSASRLGFWSAVLTTVTAAAFLAVGIATPARSGPFCTGSSCIAYPYVTGLTSFIPMDYIWLCPGFLLAIALVVLMACIHYFAFDDNNRDKQVVLKHNKTVKNIITHLTLIIDEVNRLYKKL